jgi:hypothetical protein
LRNQVSSAAAFKTIPGMGQNFLAADHEQTLLLPPDVREWLPEGHFARFVIDAVSRMDLAAFMPPGRASPGGV